MTPNRFFVYGTLKRGQCRERHWPRPVRSVVPAWAWGNLLGRDDYPALVAGTSRVLGELWAFDESDIATVMQTLDRIEGTNRPGLPNLYNRVTLEAFDLANHSIGQANAYHFASDPAHSGFSPIALVNDFQAWP